MLPINLVNYRVNIAIIFLIAIISIYIGLRTNGSDYDYGAYYEWFEYVKSLAIVDFLSNMIESTLYFHAGVPYDFEIGFAALTFILSFLSPTPEFSFIYVCFISLYIKYISLKKYGVDIPCALMIYVSWHLLLFEMTTLRVSFAGGILIYAIRFIVAHQLKYWILTIIFAAMFHTSALVALPLYYLTQLKISVKGLFFVIAAVAFIGGSIDIINLFQYFLFIPKVLIYYQLMISNSMYTDINVWNVIYIARWLTFFLIFYFYIKKLHVFTAYEIIAMKIFLLALLLYYLLAIFPVMSNRLYELLGIFQIICYPVLLKCFKRKYVAYSVLIVISFLQFYALVFHSKLVDFFYFFGKSYELFPSDILF